MKFLPRDDSPYEHEIFCPRCADQNYTLEYKATDLTDGRTTYYYVPCELCNPTGDRVKVTV